MNSFRILLSLFSKDCERRTDVTVRPNAAQKFQRDKQAGGGAFIPATVQVEVPREHKEAVQDRVRTSLTECENGELMSLDIEN